MVEQAILKQKRHWAWWFLPGICLLIAAGLSVRSCTEQGPPITLLFEQGFGLKPGDTLKYRGITVGTIEHVLLKTETLQGIEVSVRLTPEAKQIARTGSVFWVNRPQVGLNGVSGLDALIGATYINVWPGKGEPRFQFVGLEAPPLNAGLKPGGIEITLQAERLSGLQPGAPVRYRQLVIGKIITVGLSSDASAVEAQAYIQPKYLNLIRRNARFWHAGGVSATAGLSGFSFKVDSIANALLGGVELAVPERLGQTVHQGHRFTLHEKAEEHWLEWRPSILLGNPLLPQGTTLPILQFAILRWKESRYGLVETEMQKQGWLLAYEGGWIGPNDMLQITEDAEDGVAQLEVAGQQFEVKSPLQPERSMQWLASPGMQNSWTLSQSRLALGPEDIVIVPGNQVAEQQVSASRIEVVGGIWQLDPMLSFDERWHGAAVMSVKDGKLIGLLNVAEDMPVQILPMSVTVNQ